MRTFLKCEVKGADNFIENDLKAEEVTSSLDVEFVHVDLLTWEPDFEKESIDAVMCIHTLEHLHLSPRELFQKAIKCLKPEGLFIVGAPNAANLLKRGRVLFGGNNFSKMDTW